MKIPGMKSHINRKAAAWRMQNVSKETLHTWAKGKIASILHSSLHQKSLEELYEMYVCGMTASKINFLDEVNICSPEFMEAVFKLTRGKSQALIDEAKKHGIKIMQVRPSKKPLGGLMGLPKRKAQMK